jgi:hypothetical protein
MYVDFVEYYVSAVIGLRHFEKNKCTKNYREYVTISDEAFAILTIENNWDRWIDMAKAKFWKTSPVPTKCMVTRDKTATAKRKGKADKETMLNHRPDDTGVGRRKAYCVITNSSMR